MQHHLLLSHPLTTPPACSHHFNASNPGTLNPRKASSLFRKKYNQDENTAAITGRLMKMKGT